MVSFNMLVPLLFLVASVAAAPLEELSAECITCQLQLNLHHKAESAEVIQSLIKKECSSLPKCHSVLTHCQIAEGMAAVADIQDVAEFKEKCADEPHARVLTAEDFSVGCKICNATYWEFKSVNDNLRNPDNKIGGGLTFLGGVACSIARKKNNGDVPAACGAILGGRMIPALALGIADSLGSLWDQVAVKGMGCPQYQDLFTVCPSMIS